ncbi:flavodoxin [Bacillus sonorensis]|uniref:Flavodoxin n=2 Tax=Bacillus sonorensis TaxID=119858 RepID=M5PEB8_9BACI|nr:MULTISPECIES: flavodoxin [Bacillus]TWK71802.1 Flavodoxin [Bacillus paralicheniformis]ASB89830.1 NAD(P)H dehydrogenase (quinone) [Bacillus sonorensis]EME74507.1 flavodoxin [Bacillus sonorensis L12]MBG9916927.1 flavodoxin [Bacillus sonorensis]MCF7619083.1 flavodoxin [Bacillus sonorensis]
MAKALITFASMSGNTEDIAMIIKDTFTEHSIDVEYMEMDDVDVDTLSEYDYILIGTYTWGDGDLPYEAEAFYEDVSSLVLKGKKAACFGSGDYAYPKFCEAVNTFYSMLEQTGADLFSETLKVELAPETDEDIVCCKEFALSFIKWAEHQRGRAESHVS